MAKTIHLLMPMTISKIEEVTGLELLDNGSEFVLADPVANPGYGVLLIGKDATMTRVKVDDADTSSEVALNTHITTAIDTALTETGTKVDNMTTPTLVGEYCIHASKVGKHTMDDVMKVVSISNNNYWVTSQYGGMYLNKRELAKVNVTGAGTSLEHIELV